MNIIYGLVIVLVLSGMYQSIYMLNRYVSMKNKELRDKIIQKDILKYGSCCGNTESCTLDDKINNIKE
jgi:hypothetical protein